jgi:cyclase
MKDKKIFLILTTLFVVMITASAFKMLTPIRFDDDPNVKHIDNNLTIVYGGGGNSGILVTDKAVVVIDTKMGADAEKLFKQVKQIAGQKEIIVINTHYHMDHVGGNNLYSGDKIYIGNYPEEFLEKNIEPDFRPNTIVKEDLTLDLGDETVMLYNMGQAHTYNDLVVYLKNRKILFSGDLIFSKVNPVLKKESGADVDKWIAVLNTILAKWDITTIIPGHGEIGSKDIAIKMKNYFEDMKEAASNQGKQNALMDKYKEWMTIPSMASPEMTISYIKGNSN